jgi:putative flippase GtrA
MISGAVTTFSANPGARQFVKFCIVGASSAAIDFGLLNALHYGLGLPVGIAATVSFFTAVCNGFYWNRKWTFRADSGNTASQYSKFILTNVIGWLLNLTIMTGLLVAASSVGLLHTKRPALEIITMIATGQGKREFNFLALNGAKAVATVFVTAWNFTAAKLWTFKQPQSNR